MHFTILLFAFIAFAEQVPDSAQTIVNQSIVAHGMDELSGKEISFKFRSIDYGLSRVDDRYIYRRAFIKDSNSVEDYLINSHQFVRTVNSDTVDVGAEMTKRYSESINSVLYFFQIPYVLNDKAAKKKHLGTDQIKGATYDIIQVTFGEENGGQDHDDVFLYWINSQNHLVDYLAYSYRTGKGGVRFRAAINRRVVNGIVFQDYINFEATKGTPLAELSNLYENSQLPELSRIENEQILVK